MTCQSLTKERERLYLLSWGCPWPGHSGSALRTQGLLKEIAHAYDVELVVLTAAELSEEQRSECLRYARNIVEIRMKGNSPLDKAQLLWKFILGGFYAYHPAIVAISFKGYQIKDEIQCSDSIVYCACSHFYAIARSKANHRNWIIDQFDADVNYFRVRANELRNPAKKLAARFNCIFTTKYCKDMYRNVGCVVSVCEEDKNITKNLVQEARVEVIENGVDCSYFQPHHKNSTRGKKRILFTGNSDERNMKGLRYFFKNIYPEANKHIDDIEVIVGGDFSTEAREELSKYAEITFSGRVDDIRPIYEMCDVFINPFLESYGSKLKIAQALSMGICIVTTRTGARGFPLKDGETALIADNDEEFLQKLLLALNNQVLRRMIGSNGRILAEECLDWNVLGIRLRHIISEVKEEHSVAR
jgi:glycosyltransferase involved in cell wall biosynthesis